MTLTIAYRGNFQPDLPAGVTPWSTEHHVAGSAEELGHRVVRIQENEVGWHDTLAMAAGADLFLWTSTYGYAAAWPRDEAFDALSMLHRQMPTAGIHLDLWFGLDRARQVTEEPYFQGLDWLFTADGDHDDDFAAAGVQHRWSPPAVYGPECVPGTPRAQYRSDVAFVGNWRGGYHDEWWPHRMAMLEQLRRVYRQRVRFWPRGRAVRGEALNDLCASVKVTVGDSCFADRSRRYFSDRPFEAVGRGAFLVMPWIEGLAELLVDGEHCRYFPHGDHREMRRVIDHYLTHDVERERIRRAGQAHVRENHTYAHRLAALIEHVMAERRQEVPA